MSRDVYITAVSGSLVLAVMLGTAWWVVRRQQLAGNRLVSPIQPWSEAARTIWRESVRPYDAHKMQIIVGLTGMFVSLSLGYAFVDTSWVDGWQLWTWLITVLVVVAALLPMSHFPHIKPALWHWPPAITVVALLLRLPFLDTIPGGLHVDEMGVAGYAALHVFPPDALTINPFHTGASSQPTLYHYLVRLSFVLFDYTIPALRISSALAGTLAVPATFLVVTVFTNRRTALLTAVLMTAYHYHIHWSRIGLNNIWDTLWVPLILAFLAWGYKKNWSGGAVLSGLALGLSQYFYSGNKISFFLLPVVVWMLYRELPDRERLLVHVGKLGVTAVSAAAPITLFALLKPEVFFERSRVVFGWQPDAIITAVGDYNLGQYLWLQIWRNFGAFTTVPEITGFYGPGVPFLIGVAAPLFVIGFIWAIWSRQWVPVLWILLTIFLGGIMLTGAPSSSHFVVAIPAICWLVALPLNWLWQNGRWRPALALLILIILTDLVFYFGIYVPGEPRDLFNALPPWPFPQ